LIDCDSEQIQWIIAWFKEESPLNVWVGATVETQAAAERRIPALLRIPAARRFLSCEPLLGELDLRFTYCDLEGDRIPAGIHWVIAGGESGAKARPTHPDWLLSLRNQCKAAGVPFFFKQWGEWLPYEQANSQTLRALSEADAHGTQTGTTPGLRPISIARIGKKAAGRMLNEREWNQTPDPVAKPTLVQWNNHKQEDAK